MAVMATVPICGLMRVCPLKSERCTCAVSMPAAKSSVLSMCAHWVDPAAALDDGGMGQTKTSFLICGTVEVPEMVDVVVS